MRISPYRSLIIIGLSLAIFLTACKDKKPNPTNQSSQQASVANDTMLRPIENTVLIKFKNKVFGIPSPIMVSSYVHKLQLPFRADLLNSIDNSSKYISTFKQAVNLGVYTADVAYLNIYEQINLFADYFATIKQMAENLDLMNVISEETVEKIEKYNENSDTVVYLLSTVLRDIDAYLTENDQQKLGALIIAGGWIETLYFLTQLYKAYPSDELLQRIAEQKAPLTNLLNILEPYYNQGDKDLDQLFEKLAEISSFYDAIEIHYKYDKAPQVFPNKHLTVIYSQTIVNISDLDLEQITQKVLELRNWIVN